MATVRCAALRRAQARDQTMRVQHTRTVLSVRCAPVHAGVATAAEAMKGSEIEQGLLGDCYLLCALVTAVKDLQVADDLIGTHGCVQRADSSPALLYTVALSVAT